MPIILSKLDSKIANSAAQSSTQLNEGIKKYGHVFNLKILTCETVISSGELDNGIVEYINI